MSKEREVVFSDGSVGSGDFPVAVRYTQVVNVPDGTIDESSVVDPIFNGTVYGNLYGRIMTLVEATTDSSRLKAVKDVFSKEMQSWASEVHQSAREISEGGNSSTNIYTRGR